MRRRNGIHDGAIDEIMLHPSSVGVERVVMAAKESVIFNGRRYEVASSPDVVLFLPNKSIKVVEFKSNGSSPNKEEALEQLDRSQELLEGYFGFDVTRIYAYRDQHTGKLRYELIH